MGLRCRTGSLAGSAILVGRCLGRSRFWRCTRTTTAAAAATSTATNTTANVEPFLADTDLKVYLGDVFEVLPELPDGSVDCVITSPPYWGLRDYGTATWVGGDDSCDHLQPVGGAGKSTLNTGTASSQRSSQETQRTPFKATCEKCGATRVDAQLGLEASPGEYVEKMVLVFREVRRVLASHGTLWLNIGDSYASKWAMPGDRRNLVGQPGLDDGKREDRPDRLVDGLNEKGLCGMPWRVAFALQADGWYLRSDIVWSKPNPMPESITDRPTRSHEYVFMLAKQARYFFDQEAVREPFTLGSEEWYKYAFGGAKNVALAEADKTGVGRRTSVIGDRVFPGAVESAQETLDPSLPPDSPRGPDGRRETAVKGAEGSIQHRDGERWPNTGRNVRSVWEIPTHSFAEAHFATYPQELVRRCLLAGCPIKVCRVCGVPQTRVVKSGSGDAFDGESRDTGRPDKAERRNPRGGQKEFDSWSPPEQTGWSDCGHDDWRAGVVLDPFGGSGTTGLVARAHQRHSVLVELNPEYAAMIANRLQQLSLLA